MYTNVDKSINILDKLGRIVQNVVKFPQNVDKMLDIYA